MGNITDKGISGLSGVKWLSESIGHGDGSLLARRTKKGVVWYFRHTLPDGQRDTLKIGLYPVMTVKAARSKAAELSALQREHPRLREWIAEQQALEAEAVRRAAAERDHSTLGGLLQAYCGWLEAQGKTSAKSVRASIARDVQQAWPNLWAARAASITRRDLTQIISKLVAEGHGRQAGKLRAYLRAAFTAAIRAEGDPSIPPGLHGFNLDHNPAADVASMAQFNRVRDACPSLCELRALWSRIEDVGGASGAAIRLCLLLGGQRPTQLLRLRADDVDLHKEAITLRDPKGRRVQPRLHLLPLTPMVIAELRPWLEAHPKGYVLSNRQGDSPVSESAVGKAFRAISLAMLEAGEFREAYRLGDMRTGVETLLAAHGVSQSTRANLQSHGLGGIQARHYDKHTYLDEKRTAMALVESLLTGETHGHSNVVPIGSKA